MERSGTLLDYLYWRGDLSREKHPLNEIDWMVFSRLAYAPFPALPDEVRQKGITIKELCQEFLALSNLSLLVNKEMDLSFFEVLQDSSRFEDIVILDPVSKIDPEMNLQFSAYSLDIPNGPYGVIFQGTDTTVVGWKEDFHMSFQCPVKAQLEALSYLNEALARTKKDMILAGHSKGGNLSIFASAFCPYEEQDRILKVYNYDGPGFSDLVLVTPQYKQICNRVMTYLPAGSIVGILMGHLEKYEVIQSNGSPMEQHSLYNWEILRDHFRVLDSTTKGSVFFDTTVHDWFSGMDAKEREQFIEAAFEVLSRLNISDIRDLKRHKLHNALTLPSVVKNMDSSTREQLAFGLGLLFDALKNNLTPAERLKNKVIDAKEDKNN